MLIPKIYTFTTDFLIVKSNITLETTKSILLRISPKYLIIDRKIGDQKYRYTLLKDAFIEGINKYQPSEKEPLEKVLDLNENNSDVTVKAISRTEKGNTIYLPNDIDHYKGSLQSKAGGSFIIIERDNDALGLIDLSSSQYRIPFEIKGLKTMYSYPPSYIGGDYIVGNKVSGDFVSGKSIKGLDQDFAEKPASHIPFTLRKFEKTLEGVNTGDIIGHTIGAMDPLKKEKELSTLKRYPEASFPDKVNLDEINPLKVSIKTEALNSLVKPIDIPIEGEKDNVVISVSVDAPGFDIIGAQYLEIKVPMTEEDSKPIMFRLKAKATGVLPINIDFWKNGASVGNIKLLTHVVEMTSESVSSNKQTVTGNINFGHVDWADFTLIITEMDVKDNSYSYKVAITSRPNLPYKEIGPLHFPFNPEQQFRQIFKDIETFGTQTNIIDNNVKAIGQSLYDDLFPNELKAIYWKIRDSIKSIQVVSVEPWIPWEIIQPWRRLDDGKIEEDQFLCERFSFARWLQQDFVTKDKINTVKTLVPDDINLESAKSERKWIENFGKEKGFDVSNDSSFEDIISTLKNGGFDLLHVSTHGIFEPNVPTFSGIQLKGGNQLRVGNINGVATYFGKDHPMVVFSACQTGMQGFSLTSVQSWATRFLEAGASIFIGTLWSVRDDTATEFAVALYERLSAGNIPIGEAVRQARMVCKRTGDPSWLAFELYGNPDAQIKLGSK